MIPSTTHATVTAYTSDTSDTSQNIDISTLGKNDFMKLLLAQMKHQDPMNPADNTEFVAQLAQFSSLEQMSEMNANLEGTLENNQMIAQAVNNAMMISYFGKTISAESDSFYYNSQDPVEIRFGLNSPAARGVLKINNQEGITVREISLDGLQDGANMIEWDGITNIGVRARPGTYSYSIDAYDMFNNKVVATPVFSGIVDGISYRDGKAHLKVGNILIPIESVSDITEEE